MIMHAPNSLVTNEWNEQGLLGLLASFLWIHVKQTIIKSFSILLNTRLFWLLAFRDSQIPNKCFCSKFLFSVIKKKKKNFTRWLHSRVRYPTKSISFNTIFSKTLHKEINLNWKSSTNVQSGIKLEGQGINYTTWFSTRNQPQYYRP